MPLKGTVTHKSAHNFKPLPVGFRCGKLVVVAYSGSRLNSAGKRKAWYMTKCDCGAFKQIRATHLRGGRVRSCGCLVKERQRLKCQAAWVLLRALDDKLDRDVLRERVSGDTATYEE